ncbi:NADH-quinone oxidoreductase subunit N [Actinoplanes teichomyceticus]|uniref:NADH-quinone oxidoreductase subunit N n=1 Tax=Actinoplanes teichomyceticus TaxID=1867 RepID=A0A561VQP9_ACTTI|nr:NADH-quinone oxidoreductase subunit N [Actinoplanes teichomyceticus]TWG13944.1 NADH dehydrogenase subunit N [Actinoplanes teichomyceticus]GIF12232.1 NADH-quinone oxidoreductase subunit N [Actinoplanes teichomyceticus]
MSQPVDHFALLPLYAAAGTAILAFLIDLFVARRAAVPVVTALGALATAVLALVVGPEPGTFCTTGACSWVPAWPAAVTAALFAALTVGVLALSAPALRLGIAPAGEFCFLLACSMTGGVVVGYAGDLITLIVGLETLTLPLYVLVGLRRFAADERPLSTGASASLTFFLISVVSTAVTLLGAALNYAATGALHLALLTPGSGPFRPLAGVGVALLVIGLAFKVAAVPLHAWAPATYDGAPVPIAAYLSTASKLGGVLALAAVVAHLDARVVLAVLAVLTMTVGNLVALRQTRMVRLLAWSSVAQAGYILAALALGAPGVPAALAYAVFFVVLEFVAFGVVVALRLPGADGGTLLDHRGAGRRSPWLGAALTFALAGLAGLPPGLAGLFAKVSVVSALVGAHWAWLAGVVVLNAVIALAYYVRVAASLYTLPPRIGFSVADPVLLDAALHPRLPVARPVAAALIVAVAVAVVLGFAPQLLFDALT